MTMTELTARLYKNISVYLADEKVVDRHKLIEVVDDFLTSPRWHGAQRAELIAQLEASRAIWIGDDRVLSNIKGHKHWLVPGRISSWRYWERYVTYLNGTLPPKVLENLERSTKNILGDHLEDPQREGPWYRRGLICGDVQSGKTTHYTGLINRAADAGYKIIVVLAGMHNNLRSQTQARLEEGFLGYLSADEGEKAKRSPIGVGLIDPDQKIWPNTVTTRDDNGDFSTARAHGFNISPEERPYLFVIKKNKTPLTLLIQWVWQSVAQESEKAGIRKGDLPKRRDSDPDPSDPDTFRLVRKLPLLVIDDEADQASVDTKKMKIDAQGIPDDEHDPARINGLIRQLIQLFDRKAYVGYTATPFANIFIHDQAKSDQFGDDLFPESFVINAPTPSDYIGPGALFPESSETPAACGSLVCSIDDADDEGREDHEPIPWMPLKHNKDHIPLHEGREDLPPSLKEAVSVFVLSGAARLARGQGGKHHSMLIHVSRFVDVQVRVREQVDTYYAHLSRLIRFDRKAADTELRELWERIFVTEGLKTEGLSETMRQGLTTLTWELVSPHLPTAIERIEVRSINGGANDVLDYRTREASGLWVIAIGGDKLSRGLTLEGLSVSYFLRASKMYDTLMQMGRWFGYRKGYLDLCRIYLPSELRIWYGHIARASAELRKQFDQMASERKTPDDFGLKVRTHPSLMVTAAVKMRAGHTLRVGFSGYHAETIAFHASKDLASSNLRALDHLVDALSSTSAPSRVFRRDRPSGITLKWNDSLVWENAPWQHVCGFLDSYKVPEEARKFRPDLMSAYIKRITVRGVVQSWTIAVLNGEGEGPIDLPGFPKFSSVQRTADLTDTKEATSLLSIRRVVNPRDEEVDITNDEWSRALLRTRAKWQSQSPEERGDSEEPVAPSAPSFRHERSQNKGLLLIYPFTVDPAAKNAKTGLADISHLVGAAIFFPRIDDTIDRECAVEYKVNNKYWNLEVAQDAT